MTQKQVEISIQTGRRQLTFWKLWSHYEFVLYLSAILSFISFQLLLNRPKDTDKNLGNYHDCINHDTGHNPYLLLTKK